jgi:transposase
LAKTSQDARQSRRLLAIAAIYDGMRRGDAAKIGGMERQILRDWVLRFNDEGPEGLVDRKAPGAKRRLSDAQLVELASIIETGPDPDIHGVVRWRCQDIGDEIERRFGISYKERAISNLLKLLNFSHISGRPQHPQQDERVMGMFKKTSPTRSPPT